MGAGLAAVVAGDKVIERVREKITERRASKSAATQATAAIPPTPQLQPIGAVQPTETTPEKAVSPAMPTINNKISVKPEINVKINQSKRYINQQNKIKV